MATIGFLCSNFNNGRYLKQCIDSLLGQTDSRWVLYIRDDGSTDGSELVIKGYSDPRIVAEIDPKNIGLIDSLRKLVKSSNTVYLAILDPDDALEPNAVSAILHAWEGNPDAAVVYSNFYACGADLLVTGTGWSRKLNPGEANSTRFSIGHLRTFSRRAYEATTGFNSKYLYAEDADLLYRLEEQGAVIFVDQILYRYRTLPNSQSHAPIKKVVGLLNRVESQLEAFERRRRSKVACSNFTPLQMFKLLLKASAYGAINHQWRKSYHLLVEALKLPCKVTKKKNSR